MEWLPYWRILRRRWWIVALIAAVTVAVSAYSYVRSARTLGYQGCITLYVADVGSPSLISAPQTTLETAGQLLAGETAANFFGDDILDVAQSSSVARAVSGRLRARALPHSSFADLNGAVSGSRRDRTVLLCVQSPSSPTALAAAQVLGTELTVRRAGFIGNAMARRTYVRVISPAGVTPVTAGRQRLNLALRLVLGLLVAIGVALLWDALDPRVRDRADMEDVLTVPVLAEA